ncbi:hypothetical protein [Streptomyces goshikiensis]|uniref:hypothetical protein n=1 Tax=Streptomyces goshikiensis TaxID=1942 RepID=UPI003695E10B
MTKAKMTAKTRSKDVEAPVVPRDEVADGLVLLGDPLGDVLAVLDHSELNDLLNRVGKTQRTRLLQRLRVPAMGKLTPTICGHALSQLRAQRPSGQRLLDAQILGRPLYEGLSQARAEWVAGTGSGVLEESLEQAPRAELLLTAFAFWNRDPGQARVLAWALRNRALPSWPAGQVTAIADACDRLASEWAEHRGAPAPVPLPPAAPTEDGIDPVTGGQDFPLDDAEGCEQVAIGLERLFEEAETSVRRAADLLHEGGVPAADAWDPAVALSHHLTALQAGLASAGALPPGIVPARRQEVTALLRERARRLDSRGQLVPALERAAAAVSAQPHTAIVELRAQAARLCRPESWDDEAIGLAELVADVVALGDAVEQDDEAGIEQLDARLRTALPEALRPVVLLILRGKAAFPAARNVTGEPVAGTPGAPVVAGSEAVAEEEPAVEPHVATAETVTRIDEPGDREQPLVVVTTPLVVETPLTAVEHAPPGDEAGSRGGDGQARSGQEGDGRGAAEDHTFRQDPGGPAEARPVPVPSQEGRTAPSPSVDGQPDPADEMIADVLRHGESALAHHAALAADRVELAASLKLFVLAESMRTTTGACAESLRGGLADVGGDPVQGLPDRLLRAAALFRACLVSADPAAGELLRPLAESLYELPGLRATLTVAAEACARGQLSAYELSPAASTGDGSADTDVDVSSVCALAKESLVEPRSLHFPRANEIVREWWSEIGPVGSVLHAVARDDRARLDFVRAELLALRKPEALDQRLTATDNQKRHKKARLQGAARRRILQYANESLDLVHDWLTSVQNLASFRPPAVFSHLAERIEQCGPEMETELTELCSAAQPLVAATASRSLTAMRAGVALLGTGRLSGVEPAPVSALNADLLRCTSLEFDPELLPARPVTLDDVRRARETDWETAAREHAAAENYATARTALEMFELNGGRSEVVSQLSEEHHRLRAVSRQEVSALHREVRLRVETAARLGQLPEPGRSLVTAQLEAIGGEFGGDNLGTIRRECGEIIHQLAVLSEQAKNTFRAAAAQQLNESNASASLADEIRALIGRGDLATAEEFLIAARAGGEPPTVDPVTDFEAFFPGVCEALSAGVTPELIKSAANGAHHHGLDFSGLTPAQCSQAAEALTSLSQLYHQWNALRSRTRHLRLALRLAGIEYDQEHEAGLTNPPNRRWFDITDVKLVGPARLPQFGSGANGRLRVMTTRAVPNARTLLGWIEQDVSQLPVLVVIAGALSAAQRRALAAECVSRRDKPIMILDACALAFLAARGTGLFATTERILAPFSAVTPYFPEASDTLPAEMFYGRTEELSAVLDPQGSSILYGGRRLGKSALLKAAAARYRSTKHHESLYIPLPSGMGLTPYVLWDLLASSLEQSGIAQRRKHRANTMRQVEEDINGWLSRDKARKLLILFDECDEFFDGDAREGFVHTTALRNLMSSSGRRFKPVFAGLHQVQRFAALPNQPLAGAHFGEPLVIGPLSPGAAYRLLHDPMRALGISFESDMLIHRALAYANYHPKIIQHIGLALVNETHSCRTPDSEPPWTIDEDMLERVIGSAALAKSIRDTVRLTLHLDPRYKLIALVLALYAYRHGVDQPVAGRELRAECGEWWPNALSATTPDEYRALLEEMVGLGVLAADDTGWRLRSSNVLRLLGTPAGIEEELSSQENDAVTALSATHARRPLPGHRISPLTEAQIADLTARRNGLRIVIGTSAAGLDDVFAALTSQRERVPGRVAPLITPTKPSDYKKQLTAGTPGRSHRVIVSDMRKFGSLRLALEQAITLQPPEGVSRCVVALVDPSNVDHLRELTEADEENMVFLRLATADGLRSWTSEEDPMAPFSDPAQRVALLQATGGWPMLLNHVLGLALRGHSPQKALVRLAEDLQDAEGARLLKDSGLSGAAPLHALVHQLADFDEPLPWEDLVELLQPEHPDIKLLLSALRRMNVVVDVGRKGLAMEPVLASAWKAHIRR